MTESGVLERVKVKERHLDSGNKYLEERKIISYFRNFYGESKFLIIGELESLVNRFKIGIDSTDSTFGTDREEIEHQYELHRRTLDLYNAGIIS